MSWHYSQEPGGGILGGKLLGWNTVCAVELEEYPRECLLQRQRDGMLPGFPVWDDVCTFDGTPWRGLVDVVSGGFPCQDISSAGKGEGITGARSGLWKEMCRIIREVRPRYAFMENSPMLTSRGLGVVLGNLAEAGYNAAWMVLGAADVGAPHRQDRIWILAHDTNPDSLQCSQQRCEHKGAEESAGGGALRVESGRDLADAERERMEAYRVFGGSSEEETRTRFSADACGEGENVSNADCAQREGVDSVPNQHEPEVSGAGMSGGQRRAWTAWRVEPNVGRVAHGVASRVDRLKAIGNGQVPLVAAVAFCELKRILNNINNDA